MGTPVVVVPSGGLPITVVSSGGLPMEIASNGRGIAVTVVTSGGLPVTGVSTGPDVTAPIITSSNAISQPENAALTHYLMANEPVTWAKVGGTDSAKFTLASGVLTLPAKNYDAPDDSDANRTYVVQVQATDLAANPSAIQTITVTITNVNVAPTVANAIPNQTANVGGAFSFAFASNTFADADVGDTKTYTASLSPSGALPSWLTFTPGTRTFSGTPTSGDVGTLSLRVTCTDSGGLSVFDDFDIVVSAMAAMPSGALGIWYMKDLITSPRKTVPNTLTTRATDYNLLMLPRRNFGTGWQQTAITFTEGQTAPDGSSEATTISGSTGWFVYPHSSAPVPTAGQTYTVAVSARFRGGGSGTFEFYDLGTGSIPGAKTATATWQRFSTTFVSSGSAVALHENGGVAANFDICDFEMFAGSTDQNTTALTAKPARVRNMDLVPDANATVTGGPSGVWQHLSRGFIQLDTAKTISAFTAVMINKQTSAPSAYDHDAMLSEWPSWTKFNCGMFNDRNSINFGSGGNFVKGAVAQSDGWGMQGFGQTSGPFLAVFRYDGATGSIFVNGVKIKNTAAVLAAITMTDLSFGGIGNSGLFCGTSNYAMAFYNRALTDAEVVQAGSALASTAGVTITPRRLLYFNGTSITAGDVDTRTAIGNEGYASNSFANLAQVTYGYNDGVSGSVASSLDTTKLNLLKSVAVANGAPVTDWVCHLEYGANEGAAGMASMTTALATKCDALRAAGWKVIVATVLNRTDVADGGAFNTARGIHNTAVRTWVGVHCDAISDFAADATMGTAAAPDNPTYFPDKIHPSHAGHAILQGIAIAAINSV